MLVEFLKSYEHYGQAVAWVTKGQVRDLTRSALDGSARVALSRARSSRRFKEACLKTASAKIAGDRVKARFVKLMIRPSFLQVSYPVLLIFQCRLWLRHETCNHRYSTGCSHILAGTWSDPAALDGSWEDPSSQVAIYSRVGGFATVQDEYLMGKPIYVVNSPMATMFDDTSRPMLTPSSTEVFPKAISSSSAESNLDMNNHETGVVHGAVHIMLVPWHNDALKPRRRFKVSGVYSC